MAWNGSTMARVAGLVAVAFHPDHGLPLPAHPEGREHLMKLFVEVR
jgi:hypothetical protein